MTIDAAALPRTELAASTPLYRVHRAVHAAWFFDDSPLGRFNPVRVSGRGSCYWSTEPLGAFVEHFRTAMAIDAADIEVRRLSVIELSAPSTVVDLTRRRALAAGVTGSLVAGSSYVEAQQLAADLQGVVDGVIWHARHDLAGALVCGAWFGDAGVPEGALLATLPEPATGPIPTELVEHAEAEFGYRVLPRPR